MAEYNWEHYLSFADCLVHGGVIDTCSDETRLRIAISRAYYAALNKAKDYLNKTDQHLIAYGGSTHRAVIEGFKILAQKYKSQSTIYNQINTDLKGLKESRVNADYENNFNMSLEKVIFECDRARGVIDKINSLT